MNRSHADEPVHQPMNMKTITGTRVSALSLRTTAGFTLVEVLVALVILSIGLLGIARMSLSTVQANGSAFMRSQATELIQQIVDNMHANQPQAELVGANQGYNIAFGVNPGAAANCFAGGCSATQIATYDLSQWKTQLAASLPNGDGQIVVVAAANPATGSLEYTATVSVQWNDSVAQWAFGIPSTTVPAPMSITVETLL
jgi:type IV pilus assembly protein PilV